MKEIVFILLYFKTDSALFFVNLTDDKMSIFNIYRAVFCLLININEICRSLLCTKNIYIACKKGFNGTNCKQKCPFPSYGLGCQRKCNCIDKVCDHINGCMQPTRYTFVINGNIFFNHSNLND